MDWISVKNRFTQRLHRSRRGRKIWWVDGSPTDDSGVSGGKGGAAVRGAMRSLLDASDMRRCLMDRTAALKP